MSKEALTLKNVASRLDWSIIGKAKMPSRGSSFWIMFSQRQYERNQKKDLWFIYISLLFIAAIGYACFLYFPFFLMGLYIFAGTQMLLMVIPIMFTNVFRYGGILNMLLGYAGLYFKLDLGLHIFSYHYENTLFYAILISGALALYRRIWNAYIWNMLDRFALRYYKKHHISTAVPPEQISDYKEAYRILAVHLGDFLAAKYQVPEFKHYLSDETKAHFNQVIELIRKETQACK